MMMMLQVKQAQKFFCLFLKMNIKCVIYFWKNPSSYKEDYDNKSKNWFLHLMLFFFRSLTSEIVFKAAYKVENYPDVISDFVTSEFQVPDDQIFGCFERETQCT